MVPSSPHLAKMTPRRFVGRLLTIVGKYGTNQNSFKKANFAEQKSSVGKLARKNGISQEFLWGSRLESSKASSAARES